MSLKWASLGSENPASQGECVDGHTHTGGRIRMYRVPQRRPQRRKGPPGKGWILVTGVHPSTSRAGTGVGGRGSRPRHLRSCRGWALGLSLRLCLPRPRVSACLVGGQWPEVPVLWPCRAFGALLLSARLGAQGHSPFPQGNVYLADRLAWPCGLQLKATGLLPGAPGRERMQMALPGPRA